MKDDAFTADKLRAMMKEFGENQLENPFTFGGLRVVEEPLPPPKMKLAAHIMVGDQFREEFDQWLLDFFGRRTPVIKPGQVLVSQHLGTMFVSHGDARMIRNMV